MGFPGIYIILLMLFFSFLAEVAAVPITPSAADAERIAERMRAEGLSEVGYFFLYFGAISLSQSSVDLMVSRAL